jgi:hypothetical protein
MHWSWWDVMSLPDDVYDDLVEYLNAQQTTQP